MIQQQRICRKRDHSFVDELLARPRSWSDVWSVAWFQDGVARLSLGGPPPQGSLAWVEGPPRRVLKRRQAMAVWQAHSPRPSHPALAAGRGPGPGRWGDLGGCGGRLLRPWHRCLSALLLAGPLPQDNGTPFVEISPLHICVDTANPPPSANQRRAVE